MISQTYKNSGVDIDAAEGFLKEAKTLIKNTFRKGVLRGIGHFGAFFQLDSTGYEQPVLVSSTDGVGTKIKIAVMIGDYSTVGQDLINHCVNDVMCAGASPLFFMDYYATGKLHPQNAIDVIKGLCRAAEENDVSLIGGETAEMPGIYKEGDFDLAGTMVGLVDKGKIISGNNIQIGDVIIGIPSNGLHTNGYSLARKICFEIMKFKPLEKIDELEKPIAMELMKVHRSYKKPLERLFGRVEIRGISHITGGGIEGNIKRILPPQLKMEIDWEAWNIPTIFRLLQEWGNVPDYDMKRTFNMGIGLVVIVPPQDEQETFNILDSAGEKALRIGMVTG